MEREPAVRDVAERFVAAIAAKDSETIASLLLPEAQDHLIARARSMRGDVSTLDEAVPVLYGGGISRLLGAVRIDEVEVEHDLATVTYRHPIFGRDDDDVFLLRKRDGRWFVDFTPEDYASISPLG